MVSASSVLNVLLLTGIEKVSTAYSGQGSLQHEELAKHSPLPHFLLPVHSICHRAERRPSIPPTHNAEPYVKPNPLSASLPYRMIQR
jgi:hypothetical protein